MSSAVVTLAHDASDRGTTGETVVWERLARRAGASALLVAVLALAGVIGNWPLLSSFHSRYVPVAPSAALSLAVLAVVLLTGAGSRWRGRVGPIAAFLVAAANLIFLADVLLGRAWGLEGLLFGTTVGPEGFMRAEASPLATGGFVLAGLGLALATARAAGHRLRAWAGVLGTGLAGLSAMALLGYVYGAPDFHAGALRPIALPTAIGQSALGAGIVALAGTAVWPLRSFVGPSVRAVLLRGFVPAMALLLLLGTGLNVVFAGETPADIALEAAVATVAGAAVAFMVVERVSRRVEASLDDGARRLRESEEQFSVALERHAADLEQRVAQRTAELRDERNTSVRQQLLVRAINGILATVLDAQSEREVAERCLQVALSLTGSQFGFLLTVNERGRIDGLVMTPLVWEACALPQTALDDREISSYWGRTISEGRPQIVNDPDSDPDRRGLPPGHPPIACFLGVPLIEGARSLGCIGLANRPGGYRPGDSEEVEQLAAACVQAIRRKKDEQRIRGLNQELERRIAEVTAANRDLDAFSYSVSHDLRAPLRAIDGFSMVLVEEHESALSEDGRRHLRLIRDNARQMGRLIDALLRLAHLGRRALTRNEVAMGDLVQEVLGSLLAGQRTRRIQVTVGELPAVRADRALLEQVWVNLLSNAVKYTRDRDLAVIEIRHSRTGSEDVFSVRDNGVGFDMQYAHKIFGVFQRLHRADEYEGSGVGLALVHRIVRRHGGRVWAEGVVDEGATFHFTLPVEGHDG